eukprot:5139727-Alexandrium_andersonii.AAC.1
MHSLVQIAFEASACAIMMTCAFIEPSTTVFTLVGDRQLMLDQRLRDHDGDSVIAPYARSLRAAILPLAEPELELTPASEGAIRLQLTVTLSKI